MKLSQKTIDEINKHCDPKNLLVINVAGIRRLRSPIRAECIDEIGGIGKGEVVQIYAVKVTSSFPLLYLVKGRFILYSYFQILT